MDPWFTAPGVYSPIPQAWFADLAIALLSVGFLLFANFSVLKRNALRDLLVAIPASLTLGWGFVFLFNAVGIYV